MPWVYRCRISEDSSSDVGCLTDCEDDGADTRDDVGSIGASVSIAFDACTRVPSHDLRVAFDEIMPTCL